MHKHRLGPVQEDNVLPTLTGILTTYNIEVGTLVGMVAGKAVPAVSWTWDTNIATTRAAFVAAFAGVATGRSRVGSSEVIDAKLPINTEGVFDVDLAASDTVAYGELLGPAKAVGNALVNGVEVVAAEAEACFICTETMSAAGLVCRARLINTAHMRVNI